MVTRHYKSVKAKGSSYFTFMFKHNFWPPGMRKQTAYCFTNELANLHFFASRFVADHKTEKNGTPEKQANKNILQIL